jgi:hypothetical protein
MRTYRVSRRRVCIASILAGLLALPAVALAGIPVQSGNSGSWFDPARDGEGFLLEVDQNNQLVAYWFTYDENGEQQWVVGAGSADGDDNNQVTVPVIATSGPMFGDDYDPADFEQTNWGTLTFEFGSCDTLRVDYDTIDFGSGSISLIPLTVQRNSACENDAPDVVGSYGLNPDQDTQVTSFNCSNEDDNGFVLADDGTFVIDQQSGTDISGTINFQATEGDVTLVDSGTFLGTVRDNGSIQASFETTSTIGEQTVGGSEGTFSALIEDSGVATVVVLGITTDVFGGTCSLFVDGNLLKE